MMRKTQLRIVALFLLLILLCGCASKNVASNVSTEQTAESSTIGENAEVIYQADILQLEFHEWIPKCSHIVDAQYLGEKNDELLFQLTEVYKGNFNDPNGTIYVHPFLDTVAQNAVSYEEGTKYLLLLEKHSSVYKTHDTYSQPGFTYTPETSFSWDLRHTEVKKQMAAAGRTDEEEAVFFTNSQKVSDALAISQDVYLVKLVEVFNVHRYQPTIIYSCQVQKTIRGEPVADGLILIPFFLDTVELGEEYIVILSHQGNSGVYTLASKNSVFTWEEAEKVSELKLLLKQATNYNAANYYTKAAEQLEAEMKANAEELAKNPELKAQLEAELERLKEAEKNAD